MRPLSALVQSNLALAIGFSLLLAACGGGGIAAVTDQSRPQPLNAEIAAAAADILAEQGAVASSLQRYLQAVSDAYAAPDDLLEGEGVVAQSTLVRIDSADQWRAFHQASVNVGAGILDLKLTPERAGSGVSTSTGLRSTSIEESRTTRVYHVNGVKTPLTEAMENLAALAEAARRDPAIPDEHLAEMEFALHYNKTALDDGGVQDFGRLFGLGYGVLTAAETGDLSLAAEAYLTARVAAAETLGLGIDLAEAFYQWLDTYVLALPIPTDAESLRDRIEEDVAEGHKVIVVPHSQGNLFAQQALDALPEEVRRDVGVIAIASPASYPNQGTYGAFEHFTVEHDALLELEERFGFPMPAANASNALVVAMGDTPALDERITAHSFRGSYLGFEGTRLPICETLVSMHERLHEGLVQPEPFFDDFDQDPVTSGWLLYYHGDPNRVGYPNWDGVSTITGVGSGYGSMDQANSWCYRPYTAPDTTTFTVEFRAKSGAQQPNQASVTVHASTGDPGSSFVQHMYRFLVYGEANRFFRIERWDSDGWSVVLGERALGSAIHDWHVYHVIRHRDGSWTVLVDGVDIGINATPDLTYTDIGFVGFLILRDQSSIDYIQVAPGEWWGEA